MIALTSVQTTDAYPPAPAPGKAWLAEQIGDSNGGYAFLSGDAIAQILYGDVASNDWSMEFVAPKGGLDLDPGIAAIRFRSKVPGVPVTVSAALFRADEPAVRLSAGGISNLSLTFQHNGVTSAFEPILDFEDTPGELAWTLTDNSAAQTLSVALSFTNPAGFPGNVTTPGDFISGTSPLLVGGGPGTQMHQSGTLASGTATAAANSLTATVAGDTIGFRYQLTGGGVMTWGPGNAATDTTLQRVGAGNLQIGTSTQRGVLGVIADAAGSATILVRVTADANYRYTVGGDGTISWGPGNAAADSTFGRLAASVLGTTGDAITTGPTSQAFSGAQTTGVFIGTANGITAFNSVTFSLINSALTTDTFARFGINSSGLIQWGPGSAALDTSLARNSAGRLILSAGAAGARFDSVSVADTDFPFTTFRSGDSQPKFAVRGDGSLGFGPGGATALDTAMARLAANVLGTTAGNHFSVNGLTTGNFGQQGVFLQAQGGTVWTAVPAAGNNVMVVSLTGDTERRLGVQGGGNLTWGSGSAATDVTLGRVVNSPTGTGSFLELTAGAGLGYGTGTGGTVTVANGSSGTLNKPTGKVTASASVANGATGAYTVTNSVVGIDDTVIVSLTNGGGNTQRTYITAIAAGSFTIFYENSSGVAQTPVFTFAVIKGAVA